MKRKIVCSVLLGLLLWGPGAGGDVVLTWMSSSGYFYDADPDSGFLGSGTGNQALVQLIFSASGTIGAALEGGIASGDNEVWDWFVLTEGSNTSEWGDFNARLFEREFSEGYVFARIYEVETASIVEGTWYYDSTALQLQDITGVTPPQKLEMNTNLADGNSIQMNQVIPEPSVVLLLSLGCMLTLAGRRLFGRG